MPLDLAIFYALHDIGSANVIARGVSTFFATWLIIVAGIAALLALIIATCRAFRLELIAVYVRASAAAVMAAAGDALIALVLFRPRPFMTLVDIEPVIGAPITAKSFPSDHASVAFAVALTFAFAWPRYRWAFLVVAALVAVGRVLAGVHYPSDILAGALLGMLWAWLVEVVDVRRGNAFSLRIARALTRHRV